MPADDGAGADGPCPRRRPRHPPCPSPKRRRPPPTPGPTCPPASPLGPRSCTCAGSGGGEPGRWRGHAVVVPPFLSPLPLAPTAGIWWRQPPCYVLDCTCLNYLHSTPLSFLPPTAMVYSIHPCAPPSWDSSLIFPESRAYLQGCLITMLCQCFEQSVPSERMQ